MKTLTLTLVLSLSLTAQATEAWLTKTVGHHVVTNDYGATNEFYSGQLGVRYKTTNCYFIANPLSRPYDVGSNTIAHVLAMMPPPNGARVYLWDHATTNWGSAHTYTNNAWGSSASNASLFPGRGALLDLSACATNITWTNYLVGYALRNTSNAYPSGVSLISSAYFECGRVSSDLAFTPTYGDVVWQWNQWNQNYVTNTYSATPKAIACTQLTSFGLKSNLTAYATASINPATNALVVVAVRSGSGVALSSVTGNALTYTKIADADNNGKHTTGIPYQRL